MKRVLIIAVAACVAVAHPQYSSSVASPEPYIDPSTSQHQNPSTGGEGYWWQEQGIFSNTGGHETVDTGALFTPGQSTHCNEGYDCVPWRTCIDGVIDTSGAGLLDLRQGGGAPPGDLGYPLCGPSGNVCCGIPHEDSYNPYDGGAVNTGGGSIQIVGGTGGGYDTGTGGGYDTGTGGGYDTGTGGAYDTGTGGGTGGAYDTGTGGGTGGAYDTGTGGGTGGAYDTGTGGGTGGAYDTGTGGAYDTGTGGGTGGAYDTGTGGSTSGGYNDGPVHGSPPYSSCSAGLLCVLEDECNLYTGFIGARIPLYEGQPYIQYNRCTTEYIPDGVCCQKQPQQLHSDGHIHGPGHIHDSAHSHVDGGHIGGNHGPTGHHGGTHPGDDGAYKGNPGGPYVGDGGGNVGNTGSYVGDGGGNVGHTGPYGGDGGGNVGNTGPYGGDGGGNVGTTGPYAGGNDVTTPGSYIIDTTGVSIDGAAYQGPTIVDRCDYNEDCVNLLHCKNGVINTDGAGIIDLRIKPTHYRDCYPNPANTNDVGVCCSLPDDLGHLKACPSGSACVPEEFCFGTIMIQGTDTFSEYAPDVAWANCELPGLSTYGVCCHDIVDIPLPLEQKCGVSHYGSLDTTLRSRIHVPTLHKLQADFGEIPWQAIIFFSNYTYKCGASIIGEKYLLTVAHCIKGLYPEDLRIRVGEWQVNTFTEPYPYEDVDVANIVIHPHYRPGAELNNIAVIELKYPLKLEYHINRVCLPDAGYVFPPGTRCIASGWGKDSFGGTYQHILKKIEVPLVEHSYCQHLLRKTRLGKYFRLHDSYLCAGGEESADACEGDGGGPLSCLDPQTGQYVQVGITAWGIGCGVKDVPAAYTDLTKMLPFINEVIHGPGPTTTYGSQQPSY